MIPRTANQKEGCSLFRSKIDREVLFSCNSLGFSQWFRFTTVNITIEDKQAFGNQVPRACSIASYSIE